MAQLAEAARLELVETPRNDPGTQLDDRPQPPRGPQGQAVCDQMPSLEDACVADERLHRQPDGRVVGGHDRTGADADDHIDANAGGDKTTQHTLVGGAPQPTGGQDETDTTPGCSHRPLPLPWLSGRAAGYHVRTRAGRSLPGVGLHPGARLTILHRTMESWPRVVVVGPGGVGTYFGGMLARAGAPVTMLGRSGGQSAHLVAMARNGLRLETLTFDERVPVDTATCADVVATAALGAPGPAPRAQDGPSGPGSFSAIFEG